MIKIAICDDVKVYRDSLYKICSNFFGIENAEILCFSSGDELLKSNEVFDVLFLDIEMHGTDGIQVKECYEQQGKNTNIIFLTSHQERMREAFGKNVCDFLIKPIQESQFEVAMNKILFQLDKKVVEIEEQGKVYAIQVDQIQYIEAQDKYSYLMTNTGGMLFRKTLNEWEELLVGANICRVSRYCLIHLRLFERKKKEFILESGRRVRIGPNYRDAVLEQYKKYMRKKAEVV